MEIIRNVSKWGNSAGILLPKEWLGNQVKVIFIDRTLEIKKEVLSILEPYLEDILGIYLVGSYARGEQGENSDIDVIAISKNTSKTIKSGKYDVSIVKLQSIKSSLENHPILILPRMIEAKPIMNSSLLKEIIPQKILKSSFKEFIKECKRIIKINQAAISIDKAKKLANLSNLGVVYSLILRLRGVYIINNITKNKKYSKKEFLSHLKNHLEKIELEKFYNTYDLIKIGKTPREKISIETAEKMLNLLKEEVKHLENEAKKEAGKRNKIN
ncbi:MAG: DUF2080 family transposase-associated protein [Nanoarchaeota archaeon]